MSADPKQTEKDAPKPDATEGALSGVRVVDLTDERGIYGAKVLADLGADVVRPEPAGGDPLRKRGPLFTESADSASLWHAFFASNRRFFALDLSLQEDQQQLIDLISRAQIVLTCKGAFGCDIDIAAIKQTHPHIVFVETTSFGREGPWADFQAPDLVAGALGGAAATTGDVDTPPLKGFGELNFMVSGAYIAIAALSGLYNQRVSGAGQSVHVSVHECIASCLEHVFMFYWYSGTLDRSEGNVLPRRGALHWSDAYDVMNARRGSIMVTPTPDFDAQLTWLIEEDAFEDLIDPAYQEPENLRKRIERTMQVLRNWVATKDAEELFFAAQERHAPYGWVLPVAALADNPQLRARDWYQPYQIGDLTVSAPGAPYHFSETPWRLNRYPAQAETRAGILADIGWSEPDA